MAIVIYGLDSLILDVPVKIEGTQTPFDLTGCSVDSAADGPGSPIGATSTTVANATGGIVRVVFARGTFRGAPGAYTLQVRATKGTERQTVVEVPFTVRESIFVAGQES